MEVDMTLDVSSDAITALDSFISSWGLLDYEKFENDKGFSNFHPEPSAGDEISMWFAKAVAVAALVRVLIQKTERTRQRMTSGF